MRIFMVSHFPDIELLLEQLTPEDRSELEGLPPVERLKFVVKLFDYSEDEILNYLSVISGMERVLELNIPEKPSDYLPLKLIHEYMCVPLIADKNDGELQLAVTWPPTQEMERWVYAATGKHPVWRLVHPDVLQTTLIQAFGVGAASLDDSDIEQEVEAKPEDEEDENAAIIRFVNEVIANAIEDRATDIHFEPHENLLRIRYRIDGQLVPIRVPDSLEHFEDAITSRLKIMARLNISEKRRPQDGRINYVDDKTNLDIRISTLPTLYGESISLRLLNQKSQRITLEQTGMLADDQQKVRAALKRPHGIILVTGPTGSGKSTSLSGFISHINSPDCRIMTVEDPVEYEIPGVNQTPIKPEIGLNFATALRHILRQDPDVIMVGEIRDRETADISIRAALTGHLVLSTLHTNDSAGAFTRLLDMEIEPFLVASSVEMIIAQRLIRSLVPNLTALKPITEKFLMGCLLSLHIDPAEVKHLDSIIEPSPLLGSTAYKGRQAIFEILRNDDALHPMILARASARTMREYAIKNGMRTLQECGWELVKQQRTSLSEILHFADVGYEDA